MRRICFLILLAISVDTHAARFGLLDAVRETLARNPDVQLNAKQLEISQGAAREAAGAFDPVLALSAGQSHASTPLNRYQRATYSALGQPVSRANSTTTTYALSLDRTLRSGVVLSPGVSATHSIGTDNDAYGLAAQNRGRVGFDLRVPLGRGGRDSTEAPEAAARLEAEASREDLRFSVAQAVLASVSAYWNLLAAEKSLEVAREAEAGIDRLLEDTRKLIAADERPAADLLLIRANLLDKRSARLAQEQNALEARQRLGLSMGLPFEAISTLQAADGFPAAAAELPPASLQQRLFDLAMNRRADLAAARLREKSAEERLRAARGDLRAQVDVNFNLGYEGLVEGGENVLGSLVQNRGGANLGAALSYQWPVGNAAAQGRLAQRAASRDQQTIRIRAVERNVGVGVEAALQGYTRAARQLHESDEAVSLYQVTLENEKTKHRLGNSTLIDVLSVNDRLLNARLGNVLYRAGYLNALARLNFEAGTLVAEADPGYAVTPEQLLGLPRTEPGAAP